MTLTDSLADLAAGIRAAIHAAAQQRFAAAQAAAPLVIDALTVFREEQPGAPFCVWRRFPFGAAQQQAALPGAGRLFFLVGPSGAGKDTLVRWVRQRIPSDAGIVFARRTITRPTHASESHEVIDAATFRRQAEAGQFALAWQANDLYYGVRRGIEAELAAGRDVVVNGSRAYIPQLQRLFPDARIIWIEAEAAQIRTRLEARRRETGAALLRRMERAAQFMPPDSGGMIRIDNSGPVEAAGQRLLELLNR